MVTAKFLLVIFSLLSVIYHGVSDLLEQIPAAKLITTEYTALVDSVGQECESNKGYDDVNRATCGYQIYRNRARVQLCRVYINYPRDIPQMSILLRISVWSGVAYNTLLEQRGGICELRQGILDYTIRVFKMNILPGCIVKAGNYSVDALNVDEYFHGQISKMIPGRVKFYIEAYTPKGIVTCMRVLATLKPLHKSSKKIG